ncbi:MAG: hypothetical protein PHY48_11240 [Candidatus Cloacimonetes bacterium]|nr:hypothetical protein [Candidatus Cloacimonadota bacterium]
MADIIFIFTSIFRSQLDYTGSVAISATIAVVLNATKDKVP